MYARFALIITAAMLAAAALAPTALAASSTLPVELAPGEEVISHTTTSEKDSQYIVELLSSIKGVKIGADKTTVLVNDGDKTHPIEIDYSSALSGSKGGVAGKLGATDAFAAGTSGADGANKGSATGGSSGGSDAIGSSGDATGGIGLGQVAGLLLGLTVVSRVIGIVRQLGGGNR